MVRASGTTITVVNDCGFTVWPGISGSPVFDITGFELTEGNSHSFQTPANWSGRLWGRTGCTFNGSGHGSCKIGDCGSGEMECNRRLATPPVTVAKFDIKEGREEATGETANYSSPGCVKRGCASELNTQCPGLLRLKDGGGCQSPCQVFRTPVYCCNSSLMTCESTSYSRFFHSACPRSDDVTSSESYRLCEGANYTVRFCPPDDAFSTFKVGSQLNRYDQLVSISGKFTLGFFSEDYDENYLGIWYTGDAEVRKSFDHPTNVLLPGMKLGYDTRTRQNWTLTSSLSDNTSVSGAFTLSWEPINETYKREEKHETDMDTHYLTVVPRFGAFMVYEEAKTKTRTKSGYMSPEYAMEGTFSIKSDIYSFGVLIRKSSVEEEIVASPTTSDMISMLLNDTVSLLAPKRPAFFTRRVESNSTLVQIKPEDYSINNMTISVMEGR
ncbi:hypothetical protein L1987_02730 [Smallanthus sonchifolius]|uniref:Uncharacterized protein n=1 Tax=Smallanthus sonchifolius TaxID=185202 RepID=A0ACB9K8S9_9ASTR|nr:hypothetical protein L1987_02730 [Smallanthus sonchifolius]